MEVGMEISRNNIGPSYTTPGCLQKGLQESRDTLTSMFIEALFIIISHETNLNAQQQRNV